MGTKGLAFETIGVMVLGIFALFVMLSFLGVIRTSVSNIFCSAYSSIAEAPSFCEMSTCSSERETLNYADTESFMRDIAAYSITCYRQKSGCLQEDNVRLCYALIANNHPSERISEYNMTRLLEEEGGCDAIENNMVVNESGAAVIYDGSCGIRDEIEWRVKDIFIRDQSLILIEYNEVNDTVMVKA